MSELYQLPNGWEWKYVSEVLSDIKTGTTPPKNEQKYYDNPSIKWFSPSDFGEHKELVESKNKINEIAIKDKKAKVYQPNSLLLVAIGATVGKIGIVRDESSSNQQITSMRFKDDVDVDYSYYWFVRMKQTIIDTASAATLPIINQNGIKSLPFPLTSLSEQKRIVSKLDKLFEKIDKSIALHQKNMDEANVFMGSVLNDVFVELEEKYGLIKINDVVVKTNNINPMNDLDKPFTYIDISSIDNKSFKIIEPKQLIGSEAPSRAKKEVLLGDIVYSTTRPNLKNISIVREEYDNPIASTGFCVLRVNENTLNSYLFYYVITDKLFEQIEPNIRGAQYPATSDKDLKNCDIPNAPLQIQQKVVKYLDEISEKIEKIKSVQKVKMDSLKALKASILDSVFRGEL